MEYYYKVQWGISRNSATVLKNHTVTPEGSRERRILSVKIEQPPTHDEDGRWDYRVTIRFKTRRCDHANPTKSVSSSNSGRPEDLRTREQRRFESCWPLDLPVTDITPAMK